MAELWPSDHKPVESISTKPISMAPLHLQRIFLKISIFDINLIDIKGKEIQVAYCLSRSIKDNRNDHILWIMQCQEESSANSQMLLHKTILPESYHLWHFTTHCWTESWCWSMIEIYIVIGCTDLLQLHGWIIHPPRNSPKRFPYHCTSLKVPGNHAKLNLGYKARQRFIRQHTHQCCGQGLPRTLTY